MNEIKYAPIIIPTLCRHEHFKRGMESLKKNPWAKYTDVYIGLDYPASEAHWDGYKKICDYLDTGDFSVFKSFNVIRREKNYGAFENAGDMIREMYKNYDRFLFAEDDVVFSPNYLEYMDKCLAEYEDNDDIFAVNGYSHPIPWSACEGANVIFNRTFSAWGTGFWCKKRKACADSILNNDLMRNFDKAYKTGMLKRMSRYTRADYTIACLGGRKGIFYSGPTDNSIGTYLFFNNKYLVTPVLSKVRNYGNDGTGLHYKKTTSKRNKKVSYRAYDFDKQPIDTDDSFEIHPDSVVCREENIKMSKDFFPAGFIERAVSETALILYRILGVKGYKFLAEKLSAILGRKGVSYDHLIKYEGD